MLRAIINRRVHHENGSEWQDWETIDFDAPELEARLREGGQDGERFDMRSVFAVEVRKP